MIPAPIFRNVVFPVFNMVTKENSREHLNFLYRSQWRSETDLKRTQEELLARLVGHAVQTTEWYREKLKGMEKSRLGDLASLPVLEKDDVQCFGSTMVSTLFEEDDLFRNASGGSTGKPTIVYQDHRRRAIRQVDAIVRNEWAGWRLGEKVAILWGASRDLCQKKTVKEWLRAVCSLNDPLELDAFDLDEKKCWEFLKKMSSLRPTLLVGYAGALTRLALIASACKWDMAASSSSLRGIVSSAELLKKENRELISRVFNVPVFDRYGSREVGLIASECDRHQGMHVNSEGVIVEIVDSYGNAVPHGTVGSILVTDLHNYGMPLIRYRVGDRGYFVKGSCQCGRGYPLLGSIEGRESDFFIALDGTEVHGEYFTHLLYGLGNIKEFQFRQKKDLSLVISIVGAGLDRAVEEGLVTSCQRKLGNVPVLLRYPDAVPRSPSGKYLFTIKEN